MRNKAYNFPYESVFSEDIRNYVNLKQSMGLLFKTPASNLRRFDRLCSQLKIEHPILTEELISRWISPIDGESASTRIARITALKGFAEYLNANGKPTKWPAVRQKYNNQVQFVPYIFTADEITRIFEISDSLEMSKRGSQFHLIFPAILRVLYGTGLRISEVLSLQYDDVDLEKGLLTVWNSKFDNSRCVPISNSLQQALFHIITAFVLRNANISSRIQKENRILNELFTTNFELYCGGVGYLMAAVEKDLAYMIFGTHLQCIPYKSVSVPDWIRIFSCLFWQLI